MSSRGIKLFVSDIHGEYEMFSHVLRSGCGRIDVLIDELFADELDADARAELATLIYYPDEKLPLLMAKASDKEAFTVETLERLSKLYAEFSDVACAADSIPGLCRAIQLSAVTELRMLGDVFDRGPAPDLVCDELIAFPGSKVIWGNHDILWMGAALGQVGCVATVVRICARYGNLSVLEETYGIDLAPLVDFARRAYADDPCAAFGLKGSPDLSDDDMERHVKVQKAMALIQFKIEARLIDENPSFGLEDRKLLHRIDYGKGTVTIDGIEHELIDTVFPTVDPADPYRLTPEEQDVIDYLVSAFLGCEKLHRHLSFFLDSGALYEVSGDDLLIHACVPLNDDGTLKEVCLFDETLSGCSLYDAVDAHIRAAANATDPVARKQGLDLIWYLWLGEGSPLFAKSKMATFELYYVTDKAARTEVKNAFYSLLDDEAAMRTIFEDFGLDPERGTILCGHVPVKVKDGESPVKADGKLVNLDGGMSKPYRSKSGIAGLALFDAEDGRYLAALEPIPDHEELIRTNARLDYSLSVLS